MAAENVREGCVHETFAAAVATWQAGAASDPLIRRTMNAVAADERAHAQLALDVDDWAHTLLSPRAQARLAASRLQAGLALARNAGTAADPDLVRTAGLPDPRAASWLAHRLAADLWRG